MHLFKPFIKEFGTYREAYAFWATHKDFMRAGILLVISKDGHSVYERPISEPEMEKRDRSGEINDIRGVISDNLGLTGVRNHADGKLYDSKSNFRKATRRAGCYEIGNDIKPQDVNYKTPLERGVRGDYNVRPQLKDALQKVFKQ